MTITLNLTPEVEQGLIAQAHQRGLSLADYLQEIVAREARISAATKASGNDKARAFEQWAKAHRPTPPLSEEAVSRASLLRETL